MARMNRERWNKIIDDVNKVIKFPPTGCPSQAPIPHVENKTVWAKSHFHQIYDAIKATCPSVEFKADLSSRGKESWIVEIYEQLAKAFCDCANNEGVEVTAFPVEIYVACQDTYDASGPGSGLMGWREGSGPFFANVPGGVSLAAMIDGFQISAPGLCGGRWALRCIVGDDFLVINTGDIDNQGKVIYTGNRTIPRHWGASNYIPRFCKACGGDTDCDVGFYTENAEERASFMEPLEYRLYLVSRGSPCDDS